MAEMSKPMRDAPRNGTPVMLEMRDAMGVYDCGPYAWKRGRWVSVGGRYEGALMGEPQGWRSIEERDGGDDRG